jgi:CRP-like cAMP-binding protein
MADPRLQRTSRELFLAVLTGGAPDLETWVIDRLTSVVDEEDVAAGKRLFARGEQPEYIFFSREGRLRLEREGRPGWLFEGRTVVGVFDALLDRPHERTAVALTDLHLLKLRVEHWLELLEDSFGLVRAAVGNASRTVAALEARGWAAQTAPRGLVIAQVPAFAGPLSFVDRLAIFAEALFERDLWRGESFFVLEGEVEGMRLDPEIKVLFGPGSFVGGVASLGEAILAWSARAVTRVRALSMSHDDWFDLMEEHFDLVRSALSALALLRESILEQLEAKDGEVRVG